MSTEALEELSAKLAEIAPLAERVGELKNATLEQESEALAMLIERIKPILPVVSSRIQCSYFHSGQQFHEEKTTNHAMPGIELISTFKQINTDRDTRGEYGGSRLLLFQDGTLQWERRAGEWSRWQGESSGWRTEEETAFAPARAVAKYGLAAIVRGLGEELAEASEGLQKKRESYQERLELVAKVKEILG